MLTTSLVIVGIVGGYIASIYTWPTVRTWWTGASAEASKLMARARELEQSARSKF